MNGSGHSNGVPRSSDDVLSPSADTNSSTTYRPAWSGSGGGVTPELVLVDPELALAQRHTRKRKAAMSSTEPANTFPDPEQPAPAHAPTPVTSPDTSMVDVPLGTLIFRAGLLGEEQLEGALQEGMRTGKRLGEVLLERGWLNERDLGRMLAGQKGLPFVDVNLSDVEPEALAALAEDDARRQVALPLFYEDGELVDRRRGSVQRGRARGPAPRAPDGLPARRRAPQPASAGDRRGVQPAPLLLRRPSARACSSPTSCRLRRTRLRSRFSPSLRSNPSRSRSPRRGRARSRVCLRGRARARGRASPGDRDAGGSRGRGEAVLRLDPDAALPNALPEREARGPGVRRASGR